MPTLEAVKDILARKYMLPTPKRMGTNVVGVGVGTKVFQDVDSGIECVQVYVSNKLVDENLLPADKIPPEFLGVPTDVVEIGCAFSPQPRSPRRRGNDTSPGPLKDGRLMLVPVPTPPASNVNPSLSGTVCVVLADRKTTDRYLLGCNHTFAANGRIPADTPLFKKDDRERQVATTISGGHVLLDPEENLVDCAVVKLIPGATQPVDFTVPEVGGLRKATQAPLRRSKVFKHGGTTGVTEGRIVDLDADIFVEYSFGTFLFRHQMLVQNEPKTSPFAVDGDSGAPVYTKDGSLLGIVFAPAGRLTAVCPIATALDELNRQLKPKGIRLDFEEPALVGTSA